MSEKEKRLVLRGSNLFDSLKGVQGTDKLFDEVKDRSECRLCHKSRMYYCYTCFVTLPTTCHIIPSDLELPCKIDIIKHPAEVDGKSTATHAKVICPKDVDIKIHPDLKEEDYSDDDDDGIVLVFPGKSDMTKLQDLNGKKIKKAVFIDSTWSQTARILKDPRVSKLPRVSIDDRQTTFWRYQTGKPEQCLATIEAIYYFTVDYHTKVLGLPYEGQYDQLLFLYKFMYEKIHRMHS